MGAADTHRGEAALVTNNDETVEIEHGSSHRKIADRPYSERRESRCFVIVGRTAAGDASEDADGSESRSDARGGPNRKAKTGVPEHTAPMD